ncbi:hypothetical protein VQ7734_02303 [Vibrio quintilis]|uniref:Uncharacterized protein n=1 Tax=Vibrio quintilis TaxID=1117707 RepID=A0A1M7YV75_9VIBR|nr:hypothetical protein VQ7734_02303 [Vibrio quintilis]
MLRYRFSCQICGISQVLPYFKKVVFNIDRRVCSKRLYDFVCLSR